MKQRFVANSRWSDLWKGSKKGTLKSAEEELMNLLTHENVEATLSQKGLYIYEPRSSDLADSYKGVRSKRRCARSGRHR